MVGNTKTKNVPVILLAAALWTAGAFAGDAEIEAHRRAAAQAVDATGLDRIIVATAQSGLLANPKFQEKIDYFMYRVRPPSLWDAKHAAWAPARAALLETARPETMRQMKDYWPDLHTVLVREAESSFQPGELRSFVEFTSTPGAKAYFEKRLAELRAKNGEMLYDLDPQAAAELAKRAKDARKAYDALPAAEKKQVETFLANAKCGECYRPPAVAMEKYVAGEAQWLTEVLTGKFESTDYTVVDRWVAALNGKLQASLPVDSKKQLLGVLEMRRDTSLAFTYKFYWHDKADGGSHTLEFPPGHPNYAEVRAYAPGLAAGQSRVLYRDKEGVIDDKP